MKITYGALDSELFSKNMLVDESVPVPDYNEFLNLDTVIAD